MFSPHRPTFFTVALATALCVPPASSSFASGGSGGGGGGTTAPSPAPAPAGYCPQDGSPWVITLDDGSTVFANEAGGGGCVWVRSYPAGYLRLDHVDLAPGWSYVIKSNGAGTNSRVQLQF